MNDIRQWIGVDFSEFLGHVEVHTMLMQQNLHNELKGVDFDLLWRIWSIAVLAAGVALQEWS